MNHYEQYTIQSAKKSHVFKDCLWAFLVGGGICTLGEGFRCLLAFWGVSEEKIKMLIPVTLIAIACFFTGVGLFDKIAKKAGAGTLVPITGFANAMASPAIDNKAEGMVLGLGAKLFIIAGPVIVYGITASVLYGIILYFIGWIKQFI